MATLTKVNAADAGSANSFGEDPAGAVRRLRQELFGPKPGSVQRAIEDVDSQFLAVAEAGRGAGTSNANPAETRYEMELLAHRETAAKLLAAKEALIARLEETVRDRDTTIGQLRGRVHELESQDRSNPANRGAT